MDEQKTLNISYNNLLFPNIFKTFRIAVQPSRLFTAFLTLAVIFAVGWLMDLHKTVVVSGRVTTKDLRISSLEGTLTWPTELHCYISYPERVQGYIKIYQDRAKDQKIGVFRTLSNFWMANLNEGAIYLMQLQFLKVSQAIANCFTACAWALQYHTIYAVIFFAISICILGIGGGAICRGAALHFSRDQRIGGISSIKFALRKWMPLILGPPAPLVILFLLGIILVSGAGLIANIPYGGEIFLAIVFAGVLFCGGIMAFGLIWGSAAANLIVGAVAYEKTEAFDAMCRAFNYVNSRPWRLGLYTILAAFYGGICYLFIRFFAFVMLLLSRWFLDLAIFVKSAKDNPLSKIDAIWIRPEYLNFSGAAGEISRPVMQTITAAVVNFEILVVGGLVMAFAMSFYFSASTIIYCLLRNKVDNIPLDEVFIENTQPVEIQQTSENPQT